MENTKLYTFKVGSNMLSLVSEVYLANTYTDGKLPAVYAGAPYTVIGGEGFYAVPVDTEVYNYLIEDEADAIVPEEYVLDEPEPQATEEEVKVVADMLARLKMLRGALDREMQSLDSEFNAHLEAELGTEALAKYEELKLQYDEERRTLSTAHGTEITDLENEIKQRTVAAGGTIKGTAKYEEDKPLQAIFYKGRVTWNTKGLDGYALAHPMIRQFRKVGAPYASIK